jgi:transcriptional regulator with XRE-family HTH domain
MDRAGLADFLRRRREALQPEDLGLATGRRRRTAGLRREEVAALAYMSTDFYTRLEQRRGSRPSQQTVAAIARALRLTPDERDHLFRLAGHVAPPRGYRSDHVSPALVRVLDMLDTPAQVVSDLGVALRQNALAEALLGVQTGYSGPERSIIYRWFTDPEERSRFPEADHEFHSRSYAASLRAAYSRCADDGEAVALVDQLRRASREFAELWERHEVAVRSDTHKRILHPVIGLITLDCQVLTAENQTEQLVVFTATPGSEDAERLALLSVIGTQEFETGVAARRPSEAHTASLTP